jgi:dTDP-4-dehydrorhamnose reductase
MRVLLLGGSGLLGTDVRAALVAHDVISPKSSEVDVTDAGAITVAARGVDVVVNAAAYTAVDAAESEVARAFAINADGAANAARAAAAVGARLVHMSTDYVLNGTSEAPIPETASLAPRSVYGNSKAAGELAVRNLHPGPHILRTSWLYGEGGGFPATILRLVSERETVSVVTDQVGQPTWSSDVAERIAQVLEQDIPPGVYHATNSGRASWFDFARAILDQVGLDPNRIVPTDTASFARPAPRPAFSVLSHDGWRQAGLAPMRPWQDALAAAASRGVLNAA